MTVLGDARAQLRARPAKAEQEPWRFPSWDDFQHRRRVLVFDATLSHCGWAFMRSWQAGFDVIDKGCINLEASLSGYLATWEKALRLRDLISAGPGAYASGADGIVVEAPSVRGHRTESSLIAGLMVCQAFRGTFQSPGEEGSGERRISVVSATHVSSVLLGSAKVLSDDRKKAIRDAVIRLCPEAAGRGWNEHIRDAFATGAVHLFDEKRRKAE